MIVEVKWKDDEPYIVFPEGALPEDWIAGDIVEWIDNKDGSWTMKKKEINFVSEVVAFNTLAGNAKEFNARKVALYIGLQLEEMAEKIQSIPNLEGLGDLYVALEYHSRLFKDGKFDAAVASMKHADRVNALDADIDLAVVALGGAHALGANVDAACNEVMRSNMSKFPLDENGLRVVLKDENGKVMKPDSYFKPVLQGFVS